MDKERLENKILPLLNYAGIIGAVITCVAYIAIVMVMILGFTGQKSPSQTLLFSVVNGAVGFIVAQMFKMQGTIFAESIPENKALVQRYLSAEIKERKHHNIQYFWTRTIITDILMKFITVSASTFGIIYIAIEGSKDITLIWLAAVNLLMFICFGLLGLNKAYRFYCGKYMAYIQNKLREQEESQNGNNN